MIISIANPYQITCGCSYPFIESITYAFVLLRDEVIYFIAILFYYAERSVCAAPINDYLLLVFIVWVDDALYSFFKMFLAVETDCDYRYFRFAHILIDL